MKQLNQLIDKFAKYGEPLMFSVMGFILVLCIMSMVPELILLLKPYIIWIGIVLFILATVGFILNTRKIELNSAKRKADFEAMVARHDKMLRPFKKK